MMKMFKKDSGHNYEFFFTEINGKPTMISPDLCYRKKAPIKGYDNLVSLCVDINEIRDNGFPSEEEFKRFIYPIGNEIMSLSRSCGFHYAGRIVSDKADFILYCGEKDIQKIKCKLFDMMDKYPESKFLLRRSDDEKWEYYFDMLCPNKYEMQSIINRRIQKELEQRGDDSSIPREIKHWLYFKDKDDIEPFIRELETAGFQIISTGDANRNGEYGIIAGHTIAIDEQIDDITYELMDISEKHHGSYDGWESCAVAK
jgi:uncharacterized protein (TIGR01619 family)